MLKFFNFSISKFYYLFFNFFKNKLLNFLKLNFYLSILIIFIIYTIDFINFIQIKKILKSKIK